MSEPKLLNSTHFATHSFFYKAYKKNKKEEDAIESKTHVQVMKLFHEKIIHAMCEKLYVFDMPFGIGNLYIGEEVSLRKFVREVYVDENGKKTCRLAPNIGLKKCFRSYWNKSTCKIDSKFAYYLKMAPENGRIIGRYITERDSNPLKPNFRAYPILNE